MNKVPYRGKIDEALYRKATEGLFVEPFALQEVDWLRLQKPIQPSWWWASIFGLFMGVLYKICAKIFAIVENEHLQSGNYIAQIGTLDFIFACILLAVLVTSGISAWRGIKESKKTRKMIDEYFDHFRLDQ